MIRFSLALLALLAPLPAMATCTTPRSEPLGNVKVVLLDNAGRVHLVRATGPDGTASFRRLRRGEKRLRFDDDPQIWTMQVARDGRLEVTTVTRSYSCSPPGGPVRHINARELVQTNLPVGGGQQR